MTKIVISKQNAWKIFKKYKQLINKSDKVIQYKYITIFVLRNLIILKSHIQKILLNDTSIKD